MTLYRVIRRESVAWRYLLLRGLNYAASLTLIAITQFVITQYLIKPLESLIQRTFGMPLWYAVWFVFVLCVTFALHFALIRKERKDAAKNAIMLALIVASYIVVPYVLLDKFGYLLLMSADDLGSSAYLLVLCLYLIIIRFSNRFPFFSWGNRKDKVMV